MAPDLLSEPEPVFAPVFITATTAASTTPVTAATAVTFSTIWFLGFVLSPRFWSCVENLEGNGQFDGMENKTFEILPKVVLSKGQFRVKSVIKRLRAYCGDNMLNGYLRIVFDDPGKPISRQ